MEKKAEELIKRTEVKDTPFTIIETEEGKFLTMGKYRLTEPTDNMLELIEEGNKFSWNRAVQVMMIIANEAMGNNKILEEINNQNQEKE